MQNVFQFQTNKPVRVEYQDGEPLFCLADVADVLEIQNARQLKLKESGIFRMTVYSGGQNRELVFINEFNLYRVIFRSNKPEAVKFQDWIFEEVIPAIRKTGGYQNPQGSLKINPAQKQQIQAAVMARHHRTGEHWQEIYRKLHAYCRVNSYHEIPADRFQTAIAYLDSIENAPAYRPSEKPQLTDSEIHALSVCAMYLHDSAEFLYPLSRSLREIGSSFAGRAYSLAHEPQVWLDTAHNALNRLCTNLSDPQPTRRALARIGA